MINIYTVNWLRTCTCIRLFRIYIVCFNFSNIFPFLTIAHIFPFSAQLSSNLQQYRYSFKPLLFVLDLTSPAQVTFACLLLYFFFVTSATSDSLPHHLRFFSSFLLITLPSFSLVSSAVRPSLLPTLSLQSPFGLCHFLFSPLCFSSVHICISQFRSVCFSTHRPTYQHLYLPVLQRLHRVSFVCPRCHLRLLPPNHYR